MLNDNIKAKDQEYANYCSLVSGLKYNLDPTSSIQVHLNHLQG